jgi:plastocyanin
VRPRILITLPSAFLVFVLIAMGGDASVGAAPAKGSTASDVHVLAVDDVFDASTTTAGRDATVVWDFPLYNVRNHTATDGTGMGLYDSHSVVPGGSSFSYAFIAAGSYKVTCTLHSDVGMVGHVKVPVRVAPLSGSHKRTFTVIWSSQVAPTGFVYDVQVRRGAQTWKTWMDGVAAPQGGYEPKKKGTYLFRARMRRVSTDAASGYSDNVSITVH